MIYWAVDKWAEGISVNSTNHFKAWILEKPKEMHIPI